MPWGVTRVISPGIFCRRPDLPTPTHPTMRDLVPGGYLFTHLVFWTVVGLVAVGTNAVAIILSIGIGVLVIESVTKQS